MSQQPFTPSGVQQKTAELFALSDSALLVQANAIRSDFKSWMITNFILSTSQQTYMSGIDTRFINMASVQVGFATENRLPITLDAPYPLPPASVSKFIRMWNTLECGYSQANGFTATGELKISITY